MSFHKYLQEIRPVLLKDVHGENYHLIINLRGQPETGEGINYLVETMRNEYPERTLNIRSIRQSGIANLLKPVSAGGQGKGLREVQYFAGHAKSAALRLPPNRT